MHKWTTYLWKDEKAWYGAGTTGKRIYGCAWEFGHTNNNKDQLKNEWKAKKSAKNQIENTLNAIKIYGISILDANGDIDSKLFHTAELFGTRVAKIKGLNFNKEKPLSKFPTVEISETEAREMKLI